MSNLKQLCRTAALPVVAGTLALALFTPSASPTRLRLHSGGGIAAPIPLGVRIGPHPLISAHLNYYGGPVISNVRVVMVRYGSGTYLGNIAGNTAPTMASWYQQVTNSAYMDWLREYNTDLPGGTNQNIGRGFFAGTFQITPDATRNGTTISEQNVRDELAAQLDAGNLPAADANTIYMIHFPKGKKETSGVLTSCVGFCAFHNSFSHGGKNIYYSVHPDFSSGSGCDTVCGSGTEFQNQGYAASHEMIETVTDATPNNGWYDPNYPNGTDPKGNPVFGAEIGDICNQQETSFTGTDGQSYTVQKEWSNANNTCIAFPNANYYVDGVNGSDFNFGTPSHPFKTIRAAHNFVPANGKTIIYVRPTNYPEPPLPLFMNKVEQIVNWNGSGTVHVGSP